MANLNLGQDVANNKERKQTAGHIVAKSYPLWQAVGMRRYGSLININPPIASSNPLLLCISYITG